MGGIVSGIDSLINIVVEAIVDISSVAILDSVVGRAGVVNGTLGRLVPVVCSTENEVDPSIEEDCLSVVVSG